MSNEETDEETTLTEELFFEAVALVSNILRDMPPHEFEKVVDLVTEDGVVWSSKMTTYSLYLMLSGALSLYKESKR